MDYTEIEVSFSVRLRSSMHIGTGFGLSELLDDQMVQGPHAAAGGLFPYIPGSTLKGRLHHQARELRRFLPRPDWADLETRLFGRPDTAGPLIFSNAYLDRSWVADNPGIESQWSFSPGHHERSFVSLSRQRRVALEQRLFSIQVADAGLLFQGRIFGYLPETSAALDVTLLAAAMRMVTHLGGHKGRGLGHCWIELGRVTPALRDWTELLEVHQ